jgi:hypothetical protein
MSHFEGHIEGVFGTDPDQNGALEEPPGVELIPAVD